MKFRLNQIVSISDANQNFSKVSKIVENEGAALILKQNKPKFVVLPADNLSETDVMMLIAESILSEHSEAFKELAK